MEKEIEPWNFLAGLKFFSSFYRMLAVISIGLFLGYGIYFISRQISTQSFISKTGEEKIELPDGSVITMNKGAEITYPKKFSSINRLVSFSGEALFEITRDSIQSFIIRCDNLSIRTSTASFIVKAIRESPVIEVIVKTGKVALYEGSDRANEKTIGSGERAIYSKYSKKNKCDSNVIAKLIIHFIRIPCQKCNSGTSSFTKL